MTPRSQGILRQSFTVAAMLFMLVSAVFGAGLFGGPSVEELQEGALSERGSYLAPAGPAFAIWSVIYLGLVVYSIWQALPARRHDPRLRTAGGWIAASMVLNGLWLIAARYGPLISTVIVIALLLVVLARAVVLLGSAPARSATELVLLDGVTGLHLGWVTIATVANAAAWLEEIVPGDWVTAPDAWAVGVLVVVLGIGVASAWTTRRMAPALATAWGLLWVAVARLTGEPQSVPTAIASVVTAVLILSAAVFAKVRDRAREEHAPAEAADSLAR